MDKSLNSTSVAVFLRGENLLVYLRFCSISIGLSVFLFPFIFLTFHSLLGIGRTVVSVSM